ncbi:DNA polymerase III subunit delta [Candidatus Saganbacteria bacterium]|nr:DNA polymerase III subunit delta [Candidatus Saganbacteria bacterium]
MANIYLLYGEAELLIKEKVDRLKADFTGDNLNIEQVDGSEPDFEQLTTMLQTQPLFSSGDRLVIIKQADLRNKEWEAFLPALGQAAAGIRIVFAAAAVDRRSKIFRWFSDQAEVCEFKAFTDWEQEAVVAWIRQRVMASSKKIEPAAAEYLQKICGNDLLKLKSEIDKLITFIGEKGTITPADVETLASPGEMNVFALADAAAGRDLKKALSACAILAREKVEFVPLLASLAGRFRIMLMAKGAANPATLAQTLKASPFYVKKCWQEANRFSSVELQKILELLLDTDLKLKSGYNPASIFETLLTNICLPNCLEKIGSAYG